MTNLEALTELTLIHSKSELGLAERERLRVLSRHFGLPEDRLMEVIEWAEALDEVIANRR